MRGENVEDIYSLSPLQQGILFHTLYDEGSGLYFEQSVSTLQGALNVEVFRQSWQRVLDRHSALRSSFHWEDLASPVQVVHRQVTLPFQEADWRKCDAAHQGSRLESFLNADRQRGFDLSQAPLWRVALLQTAEDSWELVLSFQHVLLDRWSRYLILKEAFGNYASLAEGREPAREPARSYASYIAWLRAQDPGAAEAFWRTALRGFDKPTHFDLGLSREDGTAASHVEEKVSLSEEATARLSAFGRIHGLTMNTLVQGAWSILASRYAGEADVLTGATVSGRPPELPGVESIVGLFINTLPVRATVPTGESVVAWLRRLQDRLVEMRQYEYSALLDIQQWSEIPRGQPLFESLLVFENVGSGSPLVQGKSPVRVLRTRSAGSRTNYPLTVLALPGRSLVLRATSDSPRFPRSVIARMLGHFRQLLEAMPEDPERRVGDLPLLTEPERQELLVEWNETEAEYPRNASVHHLFEQQAEREPDAVAVEFSGERLTYADLNRRSNQLARHLCSAGVGPEVRVGIHLPRSTDMIIGMLAILKAGGAYVPIDPGLPPERAAFLARDAGIRMVLERSSEESPVAGDHVRIDPERERDSIAGESAGNLPAPAPGDLAYVLYTSGSTGQPKGVAMEHRPLVNLICWQLRSWTPPDAARTLQFAPLSFDVSFQEIFSALSSGGTLVVVPDSIRRDPAALSGFLAEKRIERLFLPFVALAQLAEIWEMDGALPSSLRELVTAGEQLQVTPEIARALAKMGGCVLHNHYGPTESHVVTASVWAGPPEQWPALPPIGRPIPNAKIYLLDASEQAVPIGVQGEICIGGIPVARGYLDRPELTAERFLPDPFGGSGGRLYRTGDMARYREDGVIEYLGRRDQQVKIRGYRVEPGEVEAALRRHPGVREGAVVARQDAGERRLIGYIVPSAGELSHAELRQFLARTLPDYMIPSLFVSVEALPLTGSGKVDRRRLPLPEGSRVGPPPERPLTATEEKVAAIWTEVLKLSGLGPQDNFFQLGGHSLLATQLISRARRVFRLELPLRMVFECPSLADFAAGVDEFVQPASPELGNAIPRASRDLHRRKPQTAGL